MSAPALDAAVAAAPALRVIGDGRRSTNRVLAAKRRNRAVELVACGLTYQQVADELDYKNRGTVHRIVQSALQAEQADNVEALRQLEVTRFDAMQAALWSRAEAGDLDAVDQCVRIIIARCRVLGLLSPARRNRVKCRQPQTVIMQANDCRERGCRDHT
jgi:hypothetical protein